MINAPAPERFVLLDGIRGVAAVAIVHRHAEFFFGRPEASSYLAVDLFFALSGFVLAHAYGERLRSGSISVSTFMTARLFRLYPLYIVALALMAAFFLCLERLGLPTPIDDLHRQIDLKELGFALVTGLLFVPFPATLTLNGALFLVSPAWSLFNELVANAVYGRWGARWSVRTVLAIIGVSAIVLIFAAFQYGKLHLGFRWNGFYAGMARVFFSFFVGVLIYRYRKRQQATNFPVALSCLAIVCLILFLPINDDLRAVFDLVVVIGVWPALLLVASRTAPSGWMNTASVFLGTASYGLYVLHIPLLAWCAFLLPQAGEGATSPLAGIVFTAFATLLSWWLTRFFDQPMQRLLRKGLHIGR